MAVRGPCKLRSTSAPRAFSGDTYSTRTPRGHFSPRAAAAAFWPMSPSMAHRNAASVLPEPVGAITSVFSPRAMAFQARACTAVGAPNVSANHVRTGSENDAIASNHAKRSPSSIMASFSVRR